MVLAEWIEEWGDPNPQMWVHTSGSTGAPKPLLVEKRRMEASARMTCQFLQLHPGDTALLCLSLRHIGGKMMAVRALIGGLRLIEVEADGHPLRNVEEEIDLAAMVPMQVYNSLQDPTECARLRRIRHLLIGGGAIDEDLERELRDFPNAVWSTYGMTETLSHIALRRLNGPSASGWYTSLPGISTTLNTEGCLVVDAPHLCNAPIITNDLAEISPHGFRILGRKDNVIVSGGIKIQIEEVEQLLRPHLRIPFLISHRRDAKFGQAVVLLYVPSSSLSQQAQQSALRSLCRRCLPPYWCPRYYIPVEALPITPTGKPQRKEAERLAARNL